jgi:murein DD-endopeptidase MepM/ murein hydrolase activator NlpD
LFTAVFTAVVVSAFWIWFYNFVPSPRPEVERRGTIVAVKPDKAAPVEIAQQVVVGPAGLAIPVVGVKREDLFDTFTAARGSGRRHDAIDIMAPEGTPVIAAADGTIEKLFFSDGGGGNTIYERANDPKWM